MNSQESFDSLNNLIHTTETLIRVNDEPGYTNIGVQTSESGSSWFVVSNVGEIGGEPNIYRVGRDELIRFAQRILQFHEVYDVPRKPQPKYEAEVTVTYRVPFWGGYDNPNSVPVDAIKEDFEDGQFETGWTIERKSLEVRVVQEEGR